LTASRPDPLPPLRVKAGGGPMKQALFFIDIQRIMEVMIMGIMTDR
jgi:hypothetical protein